MASVAQIIRQRRSRERRRAAARAQGRVRLLLVGVLALLLVVIPAGVTLGGAAWVYLDAVRGLPSPQDSLATGAPLGVTRWYDQSGQTLLLSAQPLTREWVNVADLPPYVVQAMLTAEDPDFLTTAHFDGLATFGQLWRNLLLGPLPADPTLTGRLVRNALLPPAPARTVEYAGQEFALVAEIERRYAPEEIVEWHLNTNHYGGEAYGINAAAQLYFNKPAMALSLEEAAMLAAIPLAPQYNPFSDEIAARARGVDVLRAMRTAGLINTDQFEIAAATRSVLAGLPTDGAQVAPEFITYARRQAESILSAQGRDGARLIAQGGLRVITTLDLDLYQQTACALQIHLARLAGQQVGTTTADGQPCAAAAFLPAVNATGAVPDQGVAVLIDATTGAIKSMVGAGAEAVYQPGVTLQPFVYFNAFIKSQDENPAAMVLDIPQKFPGAAEGLIYTPTNSDGRFRGPLNTRDAMSAWLLPPAVQVAWQWGLENVLRVAHRFGVNSLDADDSRDLALLERGGAVSVLDMTYAYNLFAGMGQMRGVPAWALAQGYRQRDPVAVYRIEDADGNVLWDYTAEQVALNQVSIFPAEVGYLLNDVLADQLTRRTVLGDAASVLDSDREMAIVSGMAGGSEAWTIGYTPQWTLGLHVSRSDGAALTEDAFSLNGAGAAWKAVMQYAHERDGLPRQEWARPSGIIEAAVCDRSGGLPNEVCPTRGELFISGRTPSVVDTHWQAIEINSQTRFLATLNTPRELRVKQLYFIPPPEAESWWLANNQPVPPTRYDTFSRPELFSTVQILQPAQFAYVGGVVDVRGSLDPADMQYYQVSYGKGINPSEWLQIGERRTIFQTGESIATWDTSSLEGGFYALSLTVQRNDGTAETTTIQVTVDNTAPLIGLSAGAAGQVYHYPSDSALQLSADAKDDYHIDRVEFYQNGQFLGSATTAPYEFRWRILSAGDVVFSAVAFDGVGNQSQAELTVSVLAG